MRKLIAIALVCAVASVASAQYENLLWVKGSYDLSGGAPFDQTLYQFDMNTGLLETWTTMPDSVWGNAFADSGDKWYNGGGSTIQTYRPAAQGSTPLLQSQVTLGDLGLSGTVVDFEWANDELYMLVMTQRNIAPGGEIDTGYAVAASQFLVTKITLDANGLPTGITHQGNYFYSPYYAADTLTGALAYNPDRDQWVFRGFVGHTQSAGVWVASDAEAGVWAHYTDMPTNTFNDYCSALFWQGADEAELMLFARMQNNYIRYSYGSAQGSFSGLAAVGGFGDFARVLAIPEPATLALLAIGGLAMIRRRSR